MSNHTVVTLPKSGFSFDLAKRYTSLPPNSKLPQKQLLGQQGSHHPEGDQDRNHDCRRHLQGEVVASIANQQDGIVLGADTRATNGPIVADKNCEKIHYIAPNIYCCGAGTAADTEFTTGLIASQLELHRLSSGRSSRVATAMTLLKQHLFKYQGHIGAALILGGVDFHGAHLYTIYPHGSTDKLPYVTMGSGSLAAMSVFESHWKPNMERQDAIDLVAEAIKAGIFNDLGSGSNVDVTVIESDGKVDVLRNYICPNEKPKRELSYKFPVGVTRKCCPFLPPNLPSHPEGGHLQVRHGCRRLGHGLSSPLNFNPKEDSTVLASHPHNPQFHFDPSIP